MFFVFESGQRVVLPRFEDIEVPSPSGAKASIGHVKFIGFINNSSKIYAATKTTATLRKPLLR